MTKPELLTPICPF